MEWYIKDNWETLFIQMEWYIIIVTNSIDLMELLKTMETAKA